jgi:hypothetical protein
MDMADTRRYAGRQIHAFFKEYGHKAYRNTYIKMEQSFSAVFADWQVNNLESPNSEGMGWCSSPGVEERYRQSGYSSPGHSKYVKQRDRRKLEDL